MNWVKVKYIEKRFLGCSEEDFGWLTFRKIFLDLEGHNDFKLEETLNNLLKNGLKAQDLPGDSLLLKKYEELYCEEDVVDPEEDKAAIEASKRLNEKLKAAKTVEERQMIINETFARGEKR